jgi:hypothetical protein
MAERWTAVGLATPNHRACRSIHVCLTPTSDYASQQHDSSTAAQDILLALEQR